VITIPQCHGQTDGQTTCRSNTALCVASRGKNRSARRRRRSKSPGAPPPKKRRRRRAMLTTSLHLKPVSETIVKIFVVLAYRTIRRPAIAMTKGADPSAMPATLARPVTQLVYFWLSIIRRQVVMK